MSQQTRNVVVAAPASNQAKKFETNATTWGELQGVISSLMTGNVEAIVAETRTTLNRGEAVLPTGDFKLFLVPTKNKAGAGISPDEARVLGREIAEAIVTAASRASSEDVAELKENLVEVIED